MENYFVELFRPKRLLHEAFADVVEPVEDEKCFY